MNEETWKCDLAKECERITSERIQRYTIPCDHAGPLQVQGGGNLCTGIISPGKSSWRGIFFLVQTKMSWRSLLTSQYSR